MGMLQATSRTLEITVISGENFCVDRNPVTENAYVVVRAESINCYTTGMAREGDDYPSWNEKFSLDIPLQARSVSFEVQCKMSTGAVRPVGVARIAISHFLAGSVLLEELQFLSYRLRNWDGRRNGIINFSVKVKAPEYSIPAMKPGKGTMLSSGEIEHEVIGIPVGDKNSNEVAGQVELPYQPFNM